MTLKQFLVKFPSLPRFIAYLFSKTQIDESIEAVLEGFLKQIQKLQDLAEIHEAQATFHEEEAAYNLTQANEHTRQAMKAEGIAKKLEKLVS